MRNPEEALGQLMDRVRPGSSRELGREELWEPPAFASCEDIRLWLRDGVMSATLYERYPDGRWAIEVMLKEQNPGKVRIILL